MGGKYGLLGLLTTAALTLRLHGLARFELFVDEAATWWYARRILEGGLFEGMSLEPTPPLFYALVAASLRLLGDGDWALRLPSALAGAAAVPAVWALGRELWSGRAGWLAALYLAVHPLHVVYSREARVYPLLLLLAIAALLFLARALESGRRRHWAVFAAVALAACYSHFYGLFLLAASAAAIALLARGRNRLEGLAAVALAGLLFAPYVAFALPDLRASGAAWSIEAFYRAEPEERGLGRVLEQQLVGARHHAYLRQVSRPPTPEGLRRAALLAQAVLLAAALVAGLRGRDRRRRRALALLGLFWLLPILIPWAITHGWRPIFHSGRHDVYVLGAVATLLAAGLAELLRREGAARHRRRATAAVAAVAVAVILGAAVHRLAWLERLPASDFQRATGAWIARHVGPGDRVVAFGIRRLVSERYARLAGSEAPFESFPRSTDEHPGWSDVMTLIENPEALHREARARTAELGRETPTDGAVILLLRPYERAGGSVSATWLVDRHLIENLWTAGWRATTTPEAAALDLALYRPPGSPAAAASERGHPAEYLAPETP